MRRRERGERREGKTPSPVEERRRDFLYTAVERAPLTDAPIFVTGREKRDQYEGKGGRGKRRWKRGDGERGDGERGKWKGEREERDQLDLGESNGFQ